MIKQISITLISVILILFFSSVSSLAFYSGDIKSGVFIEQDGIGVKIAEISVNNNLSFSKIYSYTGENNIRLNSKYYLGEDRSIFLDGGVLYKPFNDIDNFNDKAGLNLGIGYTTYPSRNISIDLKAEYEKLKRGDSSFMISISLDYFWHNLKRSPIADPDDSHWYEFVSL